MNSRRIIMLVAIALSAATAQAAHVEVGDLGPKPGVQPVPVPPPANPVAELIQCLEVHPPRRWRGLSVFPLTATRTFDTYNYATLDEGLASGALIFSEVGEGRVPQVAVVNTSSRYTFLMAGETIRGGKQNRVIASDVMLPPRSGRIVIDVRCIEKGRWKGAAAFGDKAGVAGFGVRRRVQSGATQEHIWSEVAERLKSLGQSPAGEDFAAAARAPEVQRQLAECERVIFPGLPGRCVGVVVARGNRIAGADVFCHDALFAKLRRKVLHGYALDVIGVRFGAAMPMDERHVQAFLRNAANARLEYVATPGVGQRARLVGVAGGHAIILNRAVTHMGLFPNMRMQPLR